MKIKTFRGGIHPADGKELSKDKPTSLLMPQGLLRYPVSQHIGAPAEPCVAKGDRVLVGQIIAEASGFISANVVCSVSGTVKAIEPHLVVAGSRVNCIVVENDGLYEAIPGFGEKRDYTKLSSAQIRDIVKAAGIVGMGGAGFPAHVKLSPKNEEEIDTILINGAECEPYLTSDYRMMMEEPEKIIGGLHVILQLFPKAEGVIAIEDNKPEAIAKLTAMVKNEQRIRVAVLKTKYPQGGERFIISAITGRKIHSAKLPADAGCIVHNIDTTIAIYMAVCESTPLIRRIITVTGDAIANPQNFNVRLGTNYQELLAAAGGFIKEPEKVITGGPMMGTALYSLDVPVAKTSSALTCFSKDEVAAMEPSACIRCGRCASVCPEHLIPQKMMEVTNSSEEFQKLNGMECCECGSCTFVCPAKRRLTQVFKQARRMVMDERRAKAK